MIFSGFERGQTPLPGGCDLLVAPAPNLTLILPLTGAGPGEGDVTVTFGLPHMLQLGSLTLQGLVFDAGVVRGYSASNGVQLTIQ